MPNTSAHAPSGPKQSADPAPHQGGGILVLIGVFKLLKATTLLLLGLGALHLVHKNLADFIMGWAQYVHADANTRWVNWLLEHAFVLSPRRLRELGVALFIYAALFATEGIGLVLRKRWGEYFTTITTGLLIPLEIVEIVRHWLEKHHVAPTSIYLTVINIAIVVYLIVRLRWDAHRPPSPARGG